MGEIRGLCPAHASRAKRFPSAVVISDKCITRRNSRHHSKAHSWEREPFGRSRITSMISFSQGLRQGGHNLMNVDRSVGLGKEVTEG
jgi:hypothetical protein